MNSPMSHSNNVLRRHRRLKQQATTESCFNIRQQQSTTNWSIMSIYIIIVICFCTIFPYSSFVESTAFEQNEGLRFHQSLTPEERLILLGYNTNVPQYEMFTANEGIEQALQVTNQRRFKRSLDERRRRRRRKRSINETTTTTDTVDALLNSTSSSSIDNSDSIGQSSKSPIIIKFDALGQRFRLHLWPNRKLLSPSFQMINEIKDSRWSKKGNEFNDDKTDQILDSLSAIEDCFYQGYSDNHPDSAAAISLCNGMQGVIEIKSGVYIINPLPTHTVDRYFNTTKTATVNGTSNSSPSSSSSSLYHIILRKNDDEFNDYECPHKRARIKPNRPVLFDLVRMNNNSSSSSTTASSSGNRSKRSIDEGDSSELNILDDDDDQTSNGNDLVRNAAPIQLDDININDVYDDDRDSLRRLNHTSNSEQQTTTTTTTTSRLNNDAKNSDDVPFNITVETAVFVDEPLIHLLSKTFPIDTEQQIVLYVLTIMNAVQLLFKQPSIGRSVEISVVLMDLLKQQPKNLHPSDNIDTYLTNFCVWQHKKRLRESGGPTPDWDHALLLSGINMYVVDGSGRRKRHVVGLAPVSGMCNSLNSCTISEGTSFQTVLVAGHEMGHSLGMEHDGPQDGNSCNKDDFVMSPTLGPGKTTWSECSRQYLDKFVLTPQATCVLGKSSHVNIIQQFIPSHQLPGERFSVDDQCRFRFGPSSRHSSQQPINEICRLVKCRVKPSSRKNSRSYYGSAGRSLYNPYPPKSTYNTHPALEGTECGQQLWCRQGRCVSKLVQINISSAEDNGLNDIDNLPISRVHNRQVHKSTTEKPIHPIRPKSTSAPKMNKLKPKANNPYQYKYNPKEKDQTFGSRVSSTSSSNGSHNSSTSSPLEVATEAANYLSTNMYNPYNSVSSTATPKSNSRWKSRTSPRPAPHPINGNWSQWSTFGPCISECVTVGFGEQAPIPIGIMTALRKCNNPIPTNGGLDCGGPDTKVKLCNAYQVCSIESSISAASGSAATVGANRIKISHDHVRYRIRTVDEYIADTCAAAAKINDKLEHHGTQYPSYDSASHSCYVWCHKRGGGYMSQGWRLPDGTPCGRNGTLSNAGFCHKGQCQTFNCLGEMQYRTPNSLSNNVYSSGISSIVANHNESSYTFEHVDCGSNGGIASGFDSIPIDKDDDNNGNHDSSYHLVRIRNKETNKPKELPTPIYKHNPTQSPIVDLVITTPVVVDNRPIRVKQDITMGPAQQNFFNSINLDTFHNHHHHPQTPIHIQSNWSDWAPVTECQYSTACITTGRGFRLVTRECKRQNTCSGRREALQLCEEINHSVHRDPTLFALYEQYCPIGKRITTDIYAEQICNKYKIKYPSLLSGNGRQLLGKNSGCIVACEDRLWKDIHYQMDAFEDGKFPFGTDCSEPESAGGVGYCLNGKCIRFDRSSISYDSAESVLYRSEILQLFAPDATIIPTATEPVIPTASLAIRHDFHLPPDNSPLYSTISNELYKRATSKHHTVPHGQPFDMESAYGTLAADSLTFATPRRTSDLESSNSRIQLKRLRRSTLNFGASRQSFRIRSNQESKLKDKSNSDLLFRKALVQEHLDPEADYVSWTLIRGHRHPRTSSHQSSKDSETSEPLSFSTSQTSHGWSPVMKKPLRPIKLSHFSLSRPKAQSNSQVQPAEHLQTFTLVKHDKNRILNHGQKRRWQTMNHVAMPLGNQTKFLDDDEDEDDEQNDNDTHKEKVHNQPLENVRTKDQSDANKIKMKIRKDFGLGHESWPSEFDDNEPSKLREKEQEFRVEPYVWSVILSECSRSCGQGIRTVRVVCTVGQKTLDDSFCDNEVKPIHKRIEPCKERDCIGRWRTQPWSECSTKCNSAHKSYQSRTIICVGPLMNQFTSNKRKRDTDSNISPPEMESFEDDDEMEITTTEVPIPSSTTDSTMPKLMKTRVYSILNHDFCDKDSKPVQWRSCDMSTIDNC